MSKPPSKAAAEYVAPDFEAILAKPESALQEHFHDWVLEMTGYDPAQAKTKAYAFREGIRIGTALRGLHQASPENQKRLAAAKKARDAAAEAAAAEVPEEKPAKAAPVKAAPAKAAKATKTAPPAEVAPPAKRAPAKKTGGRRPTATTTAPAEDDQAPF